MINRPNASPKAKTDRIVFVPVSGMMCARAGTTPSCSGFTLVQFGEITPEIIASPRLIILTKRFAVAGELRRTKA